MINLSSITARIRPIHIYSFFAAIFALEFLLAAYFQYSVTVFENVAAHINCAERILNGEQLYRDILLPPFPPYCYMRIPDVVIARWLDVSPISVVIGLDNLWALVSLALVAHILKRTGFFNTARLYFIAAVMAGVLYVFPVYYHARGDLDYFFWLLTIPYFLLRASSTMDVRYPLIFKILVGVFAALGFAYKPYFTPPLLLVEAYLLFRARSFRRWLAPEVVACVLTGIAYLIWISLALPGFLQTQLPLDRFYFEWRFDLSEALKYYTARFGHFVFPALAVWGVYLWKFRPVPPFLLVCCLTFVGYLFSTVIQMKNSGYQIFPSMAASLLSLAILLSVLNRNPGSTRKFAAIAWLVFFALTIEALVGSLQKSDAAIRNQALRNQLLDHVMEVLQKQPDPSGGIFMFGTNRLEPIFPEGVLYRHLSWDYHFYDLWLWDGIESYKHRHKELPPERIQAFIGKAEHLLRQTLTEDLQRIKPAIIMARSKQNKHFISYFSQYAPFENVMEHYTFYEQYNGYMLYVRQ